MPEVSIIVVTFNSRDFIAPCLDSVFQQVYQDFEVIAVDNGSKDDTASLIKGSYPGVTLIENRQNLGSSKARNQAIRGARGEWILTLDCDVVLEKEFLKEMLGFVKRAGPSAGMFQPKILRDDKKHIYSCGISLSGIRRFCDIGKDKPDNGKFDQSAPIFGACSAAALYKREMLEDLKEGTGYFDERFFFLVEDVDLSWRARKKGWKALYCPGATCFHSGNSSSCNRKLRQYLCFRNRYLMILKNEPFWRLLINIPFMLTYDLTRLFYLVFANRKALKALREIVRRGRRHS